MRHGVALFQAVWRGNQIHWNYGRLLCMSCVLRYRCPDVSTDRWCFEFVIRNVAETERLNFRLPSLKNRNIRVLSDVHVMCVTANNNKIANVRTKWRTYEQNGERTNKMANVWIKMAKVRTNWRTYEENGESTNKMAKVRTNWRKYEQNGERRTKWRTYEQNCERTNKMVMYK